MTLWNKRPKNIHHLINMTTSKITRGQGLLEKFLGQQRTKKANALIPDKLRSGRILDIGSGTTPFFLINTQFNEKFGIDPAASFSVLYENITLLKTDIEEETALQFENIFF